MVKTKMRGMKMKKFRVMFSLLLLLAAVIAVAYWLHPVNLADEIFMQNQGEELLWSVVANVVLGIALLLWVSVRQEKNAISKADKELGWWNKYCHTPWFMPVALTLLVLILCAMLPLCGLMADPLGLRLWWIVFVSLGILWVGVMTINIEFAGQPRQQKLLEMLKVVFNLQNICAYLILVILLCVWLSLASKGVSGLWMFYNPLYLLPALVILYFCLGKMRYFSLVLIWFLMFPALAIIVDDLTTVPVEARVEESIEVPNVM